MSSNICRICKRKLTDRTSVKLGIVPVCRAKGYLEDDKQGDLFMVEAIPDFGDVICSRDGDGVHTNVPHRIEMKLHEELNSGFMKILEPFLGGSGIKSYHFTGENKCSKCSE